LNLGGVLYRLDRRAELIDWIEKAIAAAPDTSMLYGTLAGQLLAFGRIDEAVRAMEKALELEPLSGLAHAFLAEMKQFVPGDPHLAALERAAVHSASLSPDDRCALRFALGKAYADLGRNDASFEQYLEANRLRRRMFVYDVSRTVKEVDRLKAIFTAELMRAGRGLGDPSDRPVFIVGMMRSGTTLVEQIIASHPRVHGCGEMPNFRAAAAQVVPGFPEEVLRLGSGDLQRLGEYYLQLAALSARDAVRITDKTLSNDLFVGLIHLALPNARIINVVRDPIDTCLSIFATDFSSAYPYASDLFELGRFCRAERQLMAHWRKLLPEGHFLEVRYENIVADIEGQTRRMLEFCGLEWEPACLAFDTSKHPVFTASAAQVRRPLYRSSVGRWRPAPEILKPLLDGLGEYATT
jgi:tetratricopeptide (TPR) repeat protein